MDARSEYGYVIDGAGRLRRLLADWAAMFLRSIMDGGRGRSPAFSSSFSGIATAERRNWAESKALRALCFLRRRRRKNATTSPRTSRPPTTPATTPRMVPVPMPELGVTVAEGDATADVSEDDKAIVFDAEVVGRDGVVLRTLGISETTGYAIWSDINVDAQYKCIQ